LADLIDPLDNTLANNLAEFEIRFLGPIRVRNRPKLVNELVKRPLVHKDDALLMLIVEVDEADW
jgi:hypothetical protein